MLKFYSTFSWAAFLSYMGVIFYLSSLSGVPLPEAFPHQDKAVHLIAYTLLGFLARNAFNTIGFKLGTWPFILSACYGVSDEYHQSFVLGRDSSLYDWIADCIGSLLGVYLAFPILGKFFQKINGKKILWKWQKSAEL